MSVTVFVRRSVYKRSCGVYLPRDKSASKSLIFFFCSSRLLALQVSENFFFFENLEKCILADDVYPGGGKLVK